MDWYMNLTLLILYISDSRANFRTENNCSSLNDGQKVTCICINVKLAWIANLCPKNTSLLNLDGNNYRTLYNYSFAMFWNLRSLSLNHCQIEKIEAFAFRNLSELEELSMGNNSLKDTSLPAMVFRPLKSLKSLNIGSSSFLNYPDEQLSDLKNLQLLIIKGVQKKQFGKGFSNLRSLEKLFLRPCEYSHLKNDTFINLKEIPLRHIELKCEINKVDSHAFFPLQSLTSMKTSSDNKIKISHFIPSLAVFKNRNMTLLDLDNEYNFPFHGYDELSDEDGKILGDICITHIDLGVNNIQKINPGFIRNMKYKDCLKSISLAVNSINGDLGVLVEFPLLKNLIWIDVSRQRYVNLFGKKHSRILTSNSIRKFPDRYTTLKVIVPPNLQFVNISRIQWKKSAFNFNLRVVNGESIRTVDMSYLNFISCNGTIHGLPNLQILDFSQSNCSDLSPAFFNSIPNLTCLTFQNAELHSVLQNKKYQKLLYDMNRLRFIDFSGNQLNRLTPNLLYMQRNVLKEIVLEKNVFADIPFFLSEFPQINVVSMKHNKIESLSEESRRDIDKAVSFGYNFTLYLENNPLKCNCESTDFIEWLFSTNAVFDKDKVFPCLFTDGTTKTTLWAYRRRKRIQTACISQKILYISLGLTLSLIVSTFIVSVIYKYRMPFTFWYYNIRRRYRLLRNTDNTKNYKYDVFVSYHHSDGSFVRTKLVNYLERQKGLKVCVHQRDFIAGQYIGDNIMAAIKNSRKVLILITADYLRSNWGIFELDMARMQMFQDDRDLLIILLLEDLTPADMPASLQDTWERLTCIEPDDNLHSNEDPSDEQLIWKRLYQAIVS